MIHAGATRGWRTRLRAATFWSVLGLGAVLPGLAPDPLPAAPSDGLVPASLTLAEDGRTVRLEGDLDEGVAERLAGLLAGHPGVRTLSLASEGGYVDAAEEIGAIVASRGLATYVSRLCVSACTLAFVRGRERLAARGARLGFHAPYVSDASGGERQVDASEELRSYAAAGIDPDFAAEALAVAPSELWFPGPERLAAARVVTVFVDDAGGLPGGSATVVASAR